MQFLSGGFWTQLRDPLERVPGAIGRGFTAHRVRTDPVTVPARAFAPTFDISTSPGRFGEIPFTPREFRLYDAGSLVGG
ncbi:MAG TPA: hypothetical protein DEB20_08945 [Acidimicrobiaceae bacterium]|nr:hypothetical protein [Acidimicrobiaceae bacterium]